MRRVYFIRKAKLPINWGEVEARLHELSNSPSSLSGDLSIEHLVVPANDPQTLIDRPASRPVGSIDALLEAPPLSAAHDPLHTLSWPSEGAVSLVNPSNRRPGIRAS
ncbi:hypothetical protein ACVIHH_001048 [Bradyrhizobium sp. USDA 4518]